MEKKATKIIQIAKLLAPIISSRDIIAVLKKKIITAKSSLIELDFSSVEFISRSAAHELILMKEDLRNKKEISIVNANDAVTQMLRIVAANRIAPKTQKPKFNPKRVDIKFLYNKFST